MLRGLPIHGCEVAQALLAQDFAGHRQTQISAIRISEMNLD